MNTNTQWGLAIAAIAGVTYVAIRNKRAPITAEEAEYLRPAPVARLLDDPFPLTPEYFTPDPFVGEGYVDSRPVYGSVYGASRNPGTPQIYSRPYDTTLPNLGELVSPVVKPPKTQGLPVPDLSVRIPDVRLGTSNIRNFPDMPKKKVAEDGKNMGLRATIWGGQEMDGEDTQVILDAMGPAWKAVNGGRETPIFYRADLWTPSNVKNEYLERKEFTLTSKNSAISGAVFTSKKRPDVSLAVTNCHLITSHHGRDKLRFEQWKREKASHDAVIRYYLSAGYSTAFVGDYNMRIGVRLPAAGARWIQSDGIDKLGYVNSPRGVIIKPRGFGEKHRQNSGGAHVGRIVNLKLSVPKKKN